VGEDDNKRSCMPCWSLFKSIYIDANLNLRTCTYGHYDKHIITNIRKTNNFILHNKVLEMRKKHLNCIIPYECDKCLSKL
jgi:hypothetical protein